MPYLDKRTCHRYGAREAWCEIKTVWSGSRQAPEGTHRAGNGLANDESYMCAWAPLFDILGRHTMSESHRQRFR